MPVPPLPEPTGDPALARWIRRELAADPPRAPSLIVTVWGDALVPHGGAAWLATLIRLLGAFGVNERAVRTGIFRIARDGWLAAEPVGRRSRYRLTPEGDERFARAFHRVYDAPFEPWDGGWEAVVAHAEGIGPATRRHLRDELAWAGFAAFAPGVYLRPARRDGAPVRIVESLGIERAVTGFDARDAADAGLSTLAARAETVYALSALAGDYRRFLARFSGVARAFRERSGPDPAQAFAITDPPRPRLPARAAARSAASARSAAARLARRGRLHAVPRFLPRRAAARRGAPGRRVRGRGRVAAAAQPAFYRRFAGAI